MDLFRDSADAKEATSMTFPAASKCLFYKFGHSGAIETYDMICTLSQRAMYIKMFAFLWGICPDNVDALMTKLNTGDFFLLYLLSKNVEFHAFGILMEEFSGRVMGYKKAGTSTELGERAADISPV
ncbi:innexin shaking-B-like [Penaeus monodon]|uniref:innexin shaking-B-like n=1 Tax=Penaeus monodon TaxID=6687 RepID=UPI0018A77F2C|nr:innexin shaking-B-like [Penaeus monodon]